MHIDELRHVGGGAFEGTPGGGSWRPLVKGELRPEISLLHMKVLTLIKAKSNVFFNAML